MLRKRNFYFDENPSQAELVNQLQTITGLPLSINQLDKNCLELQTEKENTIITVQWIQKRKDEEIKQVLGANYASPFPEKKQYVSVSSENPKETFLEVSIFYLLKQFGGLTIDEINLPDWAGQKWTDNQKNEIFKWLRNRFLK